MGWNFRIGTKKDAKTNTRLFSVIECYYDSGHNPNGYGIKNILENWETPDELKWTMKKVLTAFDKPVLDLDNFPNEYKP